MSRLIAGRQSCAAIGGGGGGGHVGRRLHEDISQAPGAPGTAKARESQACLQELEAAAALQRQLARVQNVDQHWQLVEVQRLCATAAPGVA